MNTIDQNQINPNQRIQISELYLSNSTINECIDKFNYLLELNKINVVACELILDVDEKVIIKDINPLFIAYLGFFKQELPQLKIIINFGHKEQTLDVVEKCRQYLFYAFFSFKYNVCTMKCIDSKSGEISISGKFLPIIFMNADNFDLFIKNGVITMVLKNRK